MAYSSSRRSFAPRPRRCIGVIAVEPESRQQGKLNVVGKLRGIFEGVVVSGTHRRLHPVDGVAVLPRRRVAIHAHARLIDELARYTLLPTRRTVRPNADPTRALLARQGSPEDLPGQQGLCDEAQDHVGPLTV